MQPTYDTPPDNFNIMMYKAFVGAYGLNHCTLPARQGN